MATKKLKNQQQIIFAVVAIAVLAFVIVFSTSGQTAKFSVAKNVAGPGSGAGIGACYTNADCQPGFFCEYTTGTKGKCTQNAPPSLTVGLKVGESAVFNGKTITLKDVGSSSSSMAIVVDVSGIAETVTGTEIVNGVAIKVEDTTYWKDDIKLRYAIITLGGQIQLSSSDVCFGAKLFVGQSTAFGGKTITLKIVGSATTPTVMVDVDGVVETVTLNEGARDVLSVSGEEVNGVDITPLCADYNNDLALRAATLKFGDEALMRLYAGGSGVVVSNKVVTLKDVDSTGIIYFDVSGTSGTIDTKIETSNTINGVKIKIYKYHWETNKQNRKAIISIT